MSDGFTLADDSPEVHKQKQFDLEREEADGRDLLEQERKRQQDIQDADSEVQNSSSNQGSNRLNDGSHALTHGIDPIKEEESNMDPPSQYNVGSNDMSSNQLPPNSNQ